MRDGKVTQMKQKQCSKPLILQTLIKQTASAICNFKGKKPDICIWEEAIRSMYTLYKIYTALIIDF